MSRPRRIPGFDYRGPYRYFLTFCTFQRRPTFRDADAAAGVMAQFRLTARELAFAILAYCLMPDHAHLLVEGTTEAADLRRFVKRAKQRTGQVHWRQAAAPLWQEGYYDRVLRAEEDSLAVARYIIENPVRAGLVPVPSDYPHLGSDTWQLGAFRGT
jgi:REP element-mobilizing transposase RayT